MALFKLPGGQRVKTFRVGHETEFVTYGADRSVISTVRKSGQEAAELLSGLRAADTLCALRGGH